MAVILNGKPRHHFRYKQKPWDYKLSFLAGLLLFFFHARSQINQHVTIEQFWMMEDSREPLPQSRTSTEPVANDKMDGKATPKVAQSPPVPVAPMAIDHSNSFSACLLWMDDNHRLPEWIAYHYFALPLRHLVIAVDPHSETQVNISQRWYDRMTIDIWTKDSDFTTESLMRTADDSSTALKDKHLRRQGQFYEGCSRHLQKHNRTFTTFHDVDEFLTISEEFYAKHQADQSYNTSSITNRYGSREARLQPGHIFSLITDYQKEGLDDVIHRAMSPKCIHAPRALYSAVESDVEKRHRGVPEWLDAKQFDTLRYRYRYTKRGDRDGLAKGIIDVSRLTEEDYSDGSAVHRPLKYACPKTQFRLYGGVPLGIHHYLGSWESYAFRNDARKGTQRRRDKWSKRAESKAGGSDDEIRDWIDIFTKETGEDLARDLLSGQGLSESAIAEKKASNHWKTGWG